MLKVTNNKMLIEPIVERTTLGNGLQINNETQSRKDIICGKCIDCEYGGYINLKIYFPLYAASTISYNGTNYMIIDVKDMLAMESYDTENN